MKIRYGFVSNSSTTSFTCCVCGETESGMDLSLYNVGWYECVNKHILCPSDLLNSSIHHSVLDDDDDKNDNALPESECPVCSFIIFTDKDLANYLERTTLIARADVFAEVKQANKRRKKLYDNEYVMYVCDKTGITRDMMIAEIKAKYTTYRDFGKAIGYKYWD